MTLTEELELCKGKKLNVDMELGASVVCHEQLKDGINITTELSDGEAVDIYVKTVSHFLLIRIKFYDTVHHIF